MHLVNLHRITSSKPKVISENILKETIIDTVVPLQTKTATTVSKLKMDSEYWEPEFIGFYNLSAPIF